RADRRGGDSGEPDRRRLTDRRQLRPEPVAACLDLRELAERGLGVTEDLDGELASVLRQRSPPGGLLRFAVEGVERVEIALELAPRHVLDVRPRDVEVIREGGQNLSERPPQPSGESSSSDASTSSGMISEVYEIESAISAHSTISPACRRA